jgi:hypothetical protein
MLRGVTWGCRRWRASPSSRGGAITAALAAAQGAGAGTVILVAVVPVVGGVVAFRLTDRAREVSR